MTTTVLLAVLFGALLHAGWNALIKSGRDAALDTALLRAMGALAAMPLLLFTGWPAAPAWPYLVASAVIHVAYYATLAGAYRHGDLGLTYPVMRGTAPVLVALGSATLLGEALSPQGWLGVWGVCGGVLLLGLARVSPGSHPQRRTALGYAVANALIIAVYTVVDGQGVRLSGNAVAYVAALILLNGLPYLLLVLWRRGAQRAEVLAYFARRWPLALGGALASMGSYGIALWAMTQAPVALVAALRETSVLFAALLATWLLREPFGWRRAAGTLTVLAGVGALRLA